MSYKMKGSPAKLGTIQGTSGHKATLDNASPAKWNWGEMIGGATAGAAGAAAGDITRKASGNFAKDIHPRESTEDFKDILESEDLGKNMWSGTIFGRKRDKERRRRLRELRAKKRLGEDRERIAESIGTMAGPASTATGLEEDI